MSNVTLNTKHVEVLVFRHISWASVTSMTALVLCFFTLQCSLLKEQCSHTHILVYLFYTCLRIREITFIDVLYSSFLLKTVRATHSFKHKLNYQYLQI